MSCKTKMMEADISEHNAVKLKYQGEKSTSNLFHPSLFELMTAIKKIHYNYKCYQVTKGLVCYSLSEVWSHTHTQNERMNRFWFYIGSILHTL